MTVAIHEDDDDVNNGSRTPTSWIGWKERGKQAYIRGDFDVALQAYAQALHHQLRSSSSPSSSFGGPSTLEQQILLSNMVACRLKLGGSAQAEAAVANAKKCIALNDQWAKGHVRLASAYIALGQSSSADGNTATANLDEGDHQTQRQRTAYEYSNDACNALQRALQLDPRNPTARDMLIRELRSRDYGGRQSVRSDSDDGRESSNSGAPRPSAPPHHMDDGNNTSNNTPRPSAPPHHMDDGNNTSNNNTRQQNQNRDRHHPYRPPPRDHPSNNTNNTGNVDIDDTNSITWKERLRFQMQRAKFWYSAQSEDVQSFLKVALAFVLLYVAFGGRFGLEHFFKGSDRSSSSRTSRRHGGGGSDDAYDEFYRSRNDRNQRAQHEEDRYGYRERERSYGDPHSSNYDDGQSGRNSYGRRSRSRSSSSSSWWSNVSGTGTSSSSSSGYGYYSHMLLLAVVSYVAQRYFGVSPYQAVFLVNMLMGRRGGGMFRARRGWGGGGNFRHRPGGMWR